VHVRLSESTLTGEANANDTPTATTERRAKAESCIYTSKICVCLPLE
jgi:hypothetical protein